MASFNKFNCFVQDVGQKVHNLNSDTLNIMLTNVAPVATNTVYSNLTDLSTGNGYTAGGAQATSNTYTQTAGLATLLANSVTFTATGGSIGPFRYAVIYNNTASGKNLIGWWDYGSSVTLTSGQTFTISLDPVNGVLTLQ